MSVPGNVRLLLIDNYDSFTYNLVQAFMVLGAEVDVRRNDAITVEQAKAAGVPVITYGVFLDAVLQFLIVGFALYVVVQQVNRLNPPAPPPPATTRPCPYCLGSIPLAASRCQHCTSQLEAVKAVS